MRGGVIFSSALLLLVGSAPTTRGDTVYTDYAAWLDAVSGLGTLNSASFTPVAHVPFTGATYTSGDLTVTFPRNDGEMTLLETGWMGDVHYNDSTFVGHDTVTFARPISAFAAMVSIGSYVYSGSDNVLLNFGGETQRLVRDDYPKNSLHFFGWVGDSPVSDLTITSDSGRHYYFMENVQYVTAENPSVVPLPAAAWGGLVLLGGLGTARRLRHAAADRAAAFTSAR